MDKVTELFAEAKALAEEAVKLAEKGEVEASEERRQEAEGKKKQAEAIKAAAGVVGQISEPEPMPANLPTEPEVPEPPAESDKERAVKAFYNLRYGQPDEEVKAVLTDLYGHDYNAKRHEQWGAFTRYLRRGDERMKSTDAELLSQVILTPEYAAEAIKAGQEVNAIKTVMVEAQSTLGGYVVPVDWQANVIQRLQGLVVMRGRAQMASTSRDALEWPVVTGGNSQYSSAVRVTWVDETPTAATAATNLTFGQEKIPIHTVMAETFLSQNLVEDAAINLTDLLARMFAEAAAIDEDNQFLTGDSNGRPEGLLPSSANGLSLSEANSGNASALTWDGLIDLIYTPDSQYRGRCMFIGEKATYKAIAKLKDSNGQYLWRDRFGNNVTEGGEPVRLMGYQVHEQEALPTIAGNAYPLLFGDPSGYVIVDRIGMTIRRHLDSETDRINQICFVMKRRLGGQCVETWKWAVQKVSA
jgi:HK97 family phage major capsid protein